MADQLTRDATESEVAIWLSEVASEQPGMYNVPLLLRIDGALDVEALERSLAALSQRHPALRSRFCVRADGSLGVIIGDRDGPVLRRCEARNLEVTTREAEAESRHPFQFADEHLFRNTLWAVNGGMVHVLLILTHHLIADGESVWVIAEDLDALYAAEVGSASGAGSDPVRQQASMATGNFTSFELNETRLKGLATSLDRAAARRVIDLPRDHASDRAFPRSGRMVVSCLEPAIVRRLEAVARDCGATLFALMVTVFASGVLGRCGGEVMPIAIPVSLREERHRATVGCHTNTVIVHLSAVPHRSLRDSVTACMESLLDALDRRTSPFRLQNLVTRRHASAMNLPSHGVPNCLFAMADDTPEFRLHGCTVREMDLGVHTARFSYSILCRRMRDGAMKKVAFYAADHYEESTALVFARDFEEALRAVAAADADKVLDAPFEETHMLTRTEARTQVELKIVDNVGKDVTEAGRVGVLTLRHQGAETAIDTGLRAHWRVDGTVAIYPSGDDGAVGDHAGPQKPMNQGPGSDAALHRVTEIWRGVLGVEEVTPDDNFFALGGHSLHAMRIVEGLRSAGYDITIRDFFSTPTVRGIAERFSTEAGR